MGNAIAVVGPPGSGKTTSVLPNEEYNIVGLNPAETVVISCAGGGKPMLFPNAKKHYKTGKLKDGANHIFQTDPQAVATIISAVGGGLKDDHGNLLPVKEEYLKYKNIVVDDPQSLQMFIFMDKALETGFAKFSIIGRAAYLPLKAAAEMTRDDVNIIFLYHSEETNGGDKKIKTAGKLVDNYLTIEGLFSFVFFTKVERDFVTKKAKYWFQTQSDGFTTAKSPAGCFEFEIPNDMNFVLTRIKEYLGE